MWVLYMNINGLYCCCNNVVKQDGTLFVIHNSQHLTYRRKINRALLEVQLNKDNKTNTQKFIFAKCTSFLLSLLNALNPKSYNHVLAVGQRH